MDLTAIAEKALSGSETPSTAAKMFLDSNARRYAVGRNVDTLNLNRVFGLDGVIDDFYQKEHPWNGIPVVNTKAVPHDAWIVNCSTSISPVAVLRHLANSGFANTVGLHQVITASDGALDWPKFVQRQRKEFTQHPKAWSEIYATLQDEISRQTFLDVLRFRLSADPIYMRSYSVRTQEQYFEEFMDFNNEVFVDAGGFDGDTTQAFADRYPNYRKIFLFEPSSTNMCAARKRLVDYRNIDFRAIGLSDSAGTLRFDQDVGSASSITDSGSSTIVVDTLDSVVHEQVTSIKMDLEGWELKALHGSTDHIASDRPKLAIAVYHDAADFRLVHQFVGSFRNNYKCFMRHYTQGWSETVMFFSK